MFDGNLGAEWNQNILRNLKYTHPELSAWKDETILKEYDDYSMSTMEESFLNWMNEGVTKDA